MSIKRVTIELDDAQDIARSTAPPASLIEEKKIESAIPITSTPDKQDDYLEPEALEKDKTSSMSPEMIGRTPSDLVFKFINRPEFIATALTFLAFLIFVKRIHNPVDLWLPLAAAAIMNIVWFGVRKFGSIKSLTKKK